MKTIRPFALMFFAAFGVCAARADSNDYPTSARAHFGVGRAYRAAGREADALAEFREAVRLDSSLTAARDAIASARLKY